MKTYLISRGEYSDYCISYVLRAEELSEEELKSYNLEATRRHSLWHDGIMGKIASYLGITKKSSNYDYIEAVGYEKSHEATEALGFSVPPDFLMEVLKEHGIVDVDYKEYNLDDL